MTRRYDVNEIFQLVDQMILGEVPPDLTLIRDRLTKLGW